MDDSQCKQFVDCAFSSLRRAQTTDQVDALLRDCSLAIPASNNVAVEQFPPIAFTISPGEIIQMRDVGVLGNDDRLTPAWLEAGDNPLVKLLYALAWKNGDLPKIKHIIKGIMSHDGEIPEQAFVFHQFGRHLADKSEPIVDQHVLRAFGIYQSVDEVEQSKLRKMSIITHRQAP